MDDLAIAPAGAKAAQTATALERKIKKLVRPDIARIEIIASDHGFTATAIPNYFHPLVTARRDKMMTEAAADGSITFSQASVITEKSMALVGRGHAKSLDAALDALASDMKRKDA